MIAGKPMHDGAQRVGDPGEWCGRGDRQPQLPVHIADQAPPRTADWEHKAPLYFRDNEGVDVSPASSTDPAMT